MRSLLSALAAIVIPASVHAVVVNEDSPCANKCGNVLQQTSPDDLVCTQKEMDSVEGDTFQACVECEITSDYATSDGETDVQWGLYNVRYATSNCLFGYPEKDLGLQGTPCPGDEACGPFMDAIKFGNVSLDESYDYCALWPLNDDVHLERCEECLQGTQGAFLANFVVALQAGCKQQPDAGLALGLDGDIFSATPVEITEPTPRVSVDPSWFDQGPLDINAKAGIAAGGLVIVISIIGFIIIWRGKRRRRAFLATLASSRPIQKGKGGWPSSPLARGPGEMGETPLSQRPLRGNGWNDSPMTDVTEQPYGRYFSPYSSQYTSPVNGNEALHGAQWPHSASTSAAAARPEQAIGLALSPERQYHDGSLMDGAASGRGRVYDDGSYEMHEVDSAGGSARGARGFQQEAPVLGHPGYGRNGESPPRRYDLTGQPPHAY